MFHSGDVSHLWKSLDPFESNSHPCRGNFFGKSVGTDQRRKEEEREELKGEKVTQWLRILMVTMGSPIVYVSVVML